MKRSPFALFGFGALAVLLVLAIGAPLAAAQAEGLRLQLSGSPGAVALGGQVTYSATVTNDGPGAKATVAFQDALPDKASFGTVSTSQGSCVGGPAVWCELGSLAAGASATVTITATANDAGLMLDRGWLSANPPWNWAHEKVVLTRVRPAVAALDLHLSGSPGSLNVGGQVTYSATVLNEGQSAAPTVAFQDALPGKASYVSATPSQGTCTGGAAVACNLGSLAAGASATVTITATANDAGVMLDRGWVSANPPGNWAHERIVVTRVFPAVAALDLHLSGSPGSLNVGGQVTYSATVLNEGQSAAPTVAFQDALPGKASYVSATPSQGTCTGGATVACNLGSLAAGASATVTITATANDAGVMLDRGWVSANPPGNWAHERIVVTRVFPAVAALDLHLSGSPGSLNVGGQVTYSATVLNEGQSAAPTVAFQDALPGKASYVSATPSQGTCTGGATVACNLGSLAAGASATVTITATANDAGVMLDRGWVSANPPGNWSHERVVVTLVKRLLPAPTVTTGTSTSHAATTGTTTTGTTTAATTTAATTTTTTTTTTSGHA